jgi:RNA 2',3'-cyclic 3'-phosphodiesterase
MRLFSALWPPEPAVAHLAAALRRVELPAAVRRIPPEKWHLTLCFYGNDADPTERAAHLDEQVSRLRAPTVRLAGAGTFAGVLWVGLLPVTARDREALRALAAAAGSAGRRFQPHITVARWRLDQPAAAMVEQLAGYSGPAWTPAEAALVSSSPGSAYTTVHSVPLISW